MPHITIEYSANVADHHDIESLVGVVHAAALEHGLPELTSLRTRAVGRDHYKIASGEPTFAFVAIHCRIGPGRPVEEQQSFIERVLAAAESQLAPDPLAIAWSIEISELDPELRINHNGVRAAMEAS